MIGAFLSLVYLLFTWMFNILPQPQAYQHASTFLFWWYMAWGSVHVLRCLPGSFVSRDIFKFLLKYLTKYAFLAGGAYVLLVASHAEVVTTSPILGFVLILVGIALFPFLLPVTLTYKRTIRIRTS